MKMLLNGVLLQEHEYSVESASITITDSDENDRKQKALSQEFTFSGAAFDMIKSSIIDSSNGRVSFLSVKIFEDSCCDQDTLIFEGILDGKSVNWCYGECTCTGSLLEHTEETKQFDCFKTTLIHDNHNGIRSATHPRVFYCIEMRPAAFQFVILALGVMVNLILLVLTPIVAIIMVIIQTINLFLSEENEIDFDGDSSTNFLEEFLNWQAQLNEALIGCSRVHPSPYVRDYIKNVCDKCGLQFQSSIYNSPLSEYYNTVLFSAPVEKGTKDDSVKYIDANQPNYSGSGFLDMLGKVHSADWDIRNGIVIFEREDYFWQGDNFVDYETLNSSGIVTDSLCYSYRDDTVPAFGRFEYGMDAVDLCGNEARDIWNNIVEWNNPYSEIQSGEAITTLDFGMARFRDDGIDQDVLAEFAQVPYMSSAISGSTGALILPAGIAWLPKLLIVTGPVDHARVVRYSRPGIGIQNDNVYNYPFIFSEHECEPNTGYPSTVANGSLYKRFHAWKNPKLTPDKGRSFKFSFRYNCAILQGTTTARYVGLPDGQGRIKQIEIDLKTKTVTISGLV